MAITKTIANLLTQAGNNIPDNITQEVSPQDVREIVQNIAQSGYNKITDAPIVGLKEYSTSPSYEYKQACLNNGDIYISNKITTPGAFNPADWDLYGDSGSSFVDINRNNYFFVDPINGDDSAAIKGMRFSPYATIAGAEADAVSGDIIYIASNIIEAECGKDGLTYIYGKGVIHSYPDTSPNISGQNWNAVYTDFGKGNISFTIMGGILEFGSYWTGSWRRSIVRLENESSCTITKAETLRGDYRANDGNMFHLNGEGSSIDVSCTGDLYNPWKVLVVGRNNHKVKLRVDGSVFSLNDSGANFVSSHGVNNDIHISIGMVLNIGGHPLGSARAMIKINRSNAPAGSFPQTRLYLSASVVDFYDKLPHKGADERGLIYCDQRADAYISFNADIVKINHDVNDPSLPGTYNAGRTAFIGASQNDSDFKLVVDCNVRLMLLGVNHNFSYFRLMKNTAIAASKNNITVNLIDSTIVSYTDNSSSYTDWKDLSTVLNLSLFNPEFVNYVFNGTTKVIINPAGIAAGKVAIGDDTNDSAYIVGEFISNATVKNSTFVDDFTGVSQSAGIPKMKLLVNNQMTDYTKYERLL